MLEYLIKEPISKTLPIGLCRNFATDGEGHAMCLRSGLKEPSLKRCLRSRNCACYDPEWYGFEEQDDG